VNDSISPLNEDLRFASDKPPYRDYLMLNFEDGVPKKLDPTLRVRIAHGRIGFGGGMAFDEALLDRFRLTVADDRAGHCSPLHSPCSDTLRATNSPARRSNTSPPPTTPTMPAPLSCDIRCCRPADQNQYHTS
jgi:hypothetical protein